MYLHLSFFVEKNERTYYNDLGNVFKLIITYRRNENEGICVGDRK